MVHRRLMVLLGQRTKELANLAGSRPRMAKFLIGGPPIKNQPKPCALNTIFNSNRRKTRFFSGPIHDGVGAGGRYYLEADGLPDKNRRDAKAAERPSLQRQGQCARFDAVNESAATIATIKAPAGCQSYKNRGEAVY